MRYFLCLVYLIFSASGLMFIKLGNGENIKGGLQIFGIKFTFASVIGYICYTVSFLIYINIIAKFNLSYINPLLAGISNILILILAIVFLKEEVTLSSVIGCVLIVSGVFLMNYKKGGK